MSRTNQNINGRKKKTLVFFSCSMLIIFLDQLTKYIIKRNLAYPGSIPVLNNFLYISNIRNSGAGFGLLHGQSTLLMWLSLIVIGFIIYYFDAIKNAYELFFVSLLLGGTIGNFIDRLLFGYVTDFIDFRIWPAFNVADSALTVGVIGLVCYYMFFETKTSSKQE
jgi:signal peptidase II